MSLIDLNIMGLRPGGSRPRPGRAPVAPRRQVVVGARTRDRLVELHVLAEHGDDAAAAEAREWLDHDPDARRTWYRVEELCREVRAAGTALPRPAAGLPAAGRRRDPAPSAEG